MEGSNTAIQEWYQSRLKERYLQSYRAYLLNEESGDWHTELSTSATFFPSEDHGQLPQEIREAFAFYTNEFEKTDRGSVRVYRVPDSTPATYVLRVSTDGDDGFLEIYDESGNFLAAARTYLEVMAWGTREWLRAQAPQPWELPPELQDAHLRTLWGQPLEGFCNVPCPATCHTPHGYCFLLEGHVEDEGTWHRCNRCGHRWGEGTDPEAAPPAQAQPTVEPFWFQARFLDNRIQAVGLKQDPLSFGTNFGYLSVTAWAIRKIEFATRLGVDDHYFIGAAIAKLGSDSAEEVETAEAELLKYGAKAYRALAAAAKVATGELQRRAESLATRLRDTLPPELLAYHKFDVLETQDAKFVGKIEGGLLAVITRQGEEQSLVMSELYSLQSLPPLASEPEIPTGPHSLDWEYGNLYGTKAAFQVTGVPYGYVCGTDLYSLNSQLSTAAVHAGVLQVGQTGVVRVEIVMAPTTFTGSERNGVTSNDLSDYPAGAFRFLDSAAE